MIRMPAIGEMGSAMRTRVRSQEFTASETGSVDSDESGPSVGGSEGFELKEDPSFWKDHNVQVFDFFSNYLIFCDGLFDCLCLQFPLLVL